MSLMCRMYRIAKYIGEDACLGIGSICMIMAAIFSPTSQHKNLVIIVILAIIFASAAVFFITLKYLASRFRKLSKKYEEIFELEFPENWIERWAQQPAVNGVLQDLARAFKAKCDQKEKLLRSLPSVMSVEVARFARDRIVMLKNVECEIAERKREFWQAHEIARKAGMRTLKKFGDYLDLKAQ